MQARYRAAPHPELNISIPFSPTTFPPMRDTLPSCATTRIKYFSAFFTHDLPAFAGHPTGLRHTPNQYISLPFSPTTFPPLRDTLPSCATTRINIFLCLFNPRPSRLCGTPYRAAPQPELIYFSAFFTPAFPAFAGHPTGLRPTPNQIYLNL